MPAAKGEVDQVLKLHTENLSIFEALGAGGNAGQRCAAAGRQGEVDQALKLHTENLSIYEAVGDKRSGALSQGDIARLQAGLGFHYHPNQNVR